MGLLAIQIFFIAVGRKAGKSACCCHPKHPLHEEDRASNKGRKKQRILPGLQMAGCAEVFIDASAALVHVRSHTFTTYYSPEHPFHQAV